MRLVILSAHYPEMFGGVSDYVFHLANNLVKDSNLEVIVITSKNDKVKTSSRVKILPEIKKWNLFCIPKLLRLIKQNKPDYLNIQYEPYLYSKFGIPFWIIFFVIILSFNKIKFITTFHEVAIRFYFEEPRYWVVAILQRLIAYILVSLSTKCVVSNKLYKNMLRFFKNKIHVIPVGSNIIPINISGEELKEIKYSLAPKGEVIISNFGADFRENILLLDALKMLKEKGVFVKLVFIGAVPALWVDTAKKKARNLSINEDVYFTGFLPSDVVYKYLCASDIFIILERLDKKGRGGMGAKSGSLAAAFAAGLPIICNKGDLTDDFFKNKENCILLDKLSIETVTGAMSLLISDKLLCYNLKQNSLKLYENKLSWGIIANEYKKLL